jgi:hypothetical protein
MSINPQIYLLKKYYHNKQIKIYAIRHIPIIFLIFLVISLILIYYSYYNNDEKIKLILDKFCNLFIGMTIVIVGVYLLSVRFEHVYKIHILNNKINNIIDRRLNSSNNSGYINVKL